MIQDLKAKDWNHHEAAHYKAMRVAFNDHKQRISRNVLNNECKRATWSSYINAATTIRILQNNEPKVLNWMLLKKCLSILETHINHVFQSFKA